MVLYRYHKSYDIAFFLFKHLFFQRSSMNICQTRCGEKMNASIYRLRSCRHILPCFAIVSKIEEKVNFTRETFCYFTCVCMYFLWIICYYDRIFRSCKFFCAKNYDVPTIEVHVISRAYQIHVTLISTPDNTQNLFYP